MKQTIGAVIFILVVAILSLAATSQIGYFSAIKNGANTLTINGSRNVGQLYSSGSPITAATLANASFTGWVNISGAANKFLMVDAANNLAPLNAADFKGNLGITNGSNLAWVDVPYNAADYAPGGAGNNCTVEAGDVATYKYILSGDLMMVTFAFNDFQSSDYVRVTIPANKTSNAATYAIVASADNGVYNFTHAYTAANITTFLIRKIDGSSFSNAVNGTTVRGTINLQVK